MATFSCGSYFLLKQAESNPRCSKNMIKFLLRSEWPLSDWSVQQEQTCSVSKGCASSDSSNKGHCCSLGRF